MHIRGNRADGTQLSDQASLAVSPVRNHQQICSFLHASLRFSFYAWNRPHHSSASRHSTDDDDDDDRARWPAFFDELKSWTPDPDSFSVPHLPRDRFSGGSVLELSVSDVVVVEGREKKKAERGKSFLGAVQSSNNHDSTAASSRLCSEESFLEAAFCEIFFFFKQSRH